MSGFATRLAGAAALMLLAHGGAGAQTLLQPGETVTFQLDGGRFTNDIAIDVPASARQLRLELDGPAGTDLDLLLRHGEAFPVNGNAGVFGGLDWLFEHAHYRSISAGAEETILVTRRQVQPLREGRWHLAVLNYGDAPAQVQLRASISSQAPGAVPITVSFDDQAGCAGSGAGTAEWFDSTPAAAVGGNTGATLGEQRRNAFNHALERIRSQLTGTAPIHIRACWSALGGDADRATLASAGPTTLVRDDVAFGPRTSAAPFLASTHTWYASAGASQLAGTDRCRHAGGNCGAPDVFIQFNGDVERGTVLGGRKFHYGFGAPPAGGTQSIDFVATAMHEITHGLGFVGLLNLDADAGPIGEKFRACYNDGFCEAEGHDDAYSNATGHLQGNTVTPLSELDDAARAAALTSGFGLRWIDEAAVQSPANPHRDQPFPGNLPRLYAPVSIEPGSSLSHLDTSVTGELMRPFVTAGARELGLAAPMLSAVGWRQTDAAVPTPARPYGGQWFDPARNGHGIDLHRVEGTPDTYMMVLYTFDADGRPEWYIAIGRIVDGVFRPGNDANGNSLWRTRYLFGPPPGQEEDTSVPGQVRIDFNQGGRAPACRDGVGRNDPLALMRFSLGDEDMSWCLTQIVPEPARPALDRTGHWFAGADDSGWGVTTLAYGESGLFMVLYYPDSQGRPRWAFAQTDTFAPGEPMPLRQVAGYCRTCAAPAGGNPMSIVGEVTLTLDAPEGSEGRISFDVSYAGPGGGRFTRSNVPMIRLAESAPAQ
jgi:hypothetical protein